MNDKKKKFYISEDVIILRTINIKKKSLFLMILKSMEIFLVAVPFLQRVRKWEWNKINFQIPFLEDIFPRMCNRVFLT